jgi:hypothetical protein
MTNQHPTYWKQRNGELKLVHIVGYTSVTHLLTEHSLSKTNVELCVL